MEVFMKTAGTELAGTKYCLLARVSLEDCICDISSPIDLICINEARIKLHFISDWRNAKTNGALLITGSTK